jgi:hypothetical protein
MATPTGDPRSSDVYRQITARLENFRPAFKVERYIESGLSAGADVLHGITFVPSKSKWYDIVIALRVTKTLDGKDAFAEGRSPEKPANWALDASMGHTIGKGFREIWWPKLSERPLSFDICPIGTGPDGILSLAHFAVARDQLNIHIDQIGFVGGTAGELSSIRTLHNALSATF